MKYTSEELLLAAAVRDLAVNFRGRDYEAARRSFEQKNEPESGEDKTAYWVTVRAFEADWYARNPVDDFIHPALRALERAAEIMKTQPPNASHEP